MRRVAVCVGLAMLAGCGDRDPAPRAAPASDRPEAPLEATGRPDSQTLAAVRRRGRLNCGVHEGLVGFAYTDNRGRWRGFDVDFCRATAAAVLGDPDAVRFVPLTAGQRFEALAEGRIDVLWRNTSWTMERDVSGRLEFAGVNYYDGQGFMARRALELAGASDLNGARICVQAGSTSQDNLADWFRSRGLEYTPVVADSENQARELYAREACDAFTADVSALAAARTTLASPRDHVILPNVISKEALGPVVREGDQTWTEIIRWTLDALILAEELGVTQANVAELARSSADPRVRRLLGVQGEFGASLGLRETWARDAIAAEGNYGEIFARNLGPESPLDLARGLNAQWNARPAGLMYALPIR
jgi:general L-amino acid transport system substrate-binding protein